MLRHGPKNSVVQLTRWYRYCINNLIIVATAWFYGVSNNHVEIGLVALTKIFVETRTNHCIVDEYK